MNYAFPHDPDSDELCTEALPHDLNDRARLELQLQKLFPSVEVFGPYNRGEVFERINPRFGIKMLEPYVSFVRPVRVVPGGEEGYVLFNVTW